MTKQRSQRLLVLGTSLAYLLIGLEVLIMITPFALFFYSVYGPLLETLAASPLTAWSIAFFLPHLVFVDDPLLVGLSYLQALFVVGLLLFLLAAVPLYWGRLTGRGVVAWGPYARIRHPQYLALAVSGLGLLLYWPRLIILLLYLTMLFVYYLLARNEEWRMRREAPGGYEAYMARTWMFLPGEPGGRLYRLLFGKLPRWLGLCLLYLTVLSGGALAALALRSYTLERLPRAQAGETALVSVYPRPAGELEALHARALALPEVRQALGGEEPPLVYLMPGDYFLTGLLLAEGPRYSEAKLRRYPQLRDWAERGHDSGLVRFFRLGYKFYRTIGTAHRVYDVERIVFVHAAAPDGGPPPAGPLSAAAVRTPALVVDLDAETGELLAVTPASGENRWGRLPMPAL